MKYLKTYNESLRDKMKPKSDDEILKDLGNLSPIKMLLKSAVNNYLNGVKKAIELGANINGMDDRGFYSALMLATIKNNKDMVKFLIENGADINMQNIIGNTALIICTLKGNIDIMRILVDAGADVNIKNKQGETALYLVSSYVPNKNQMLELLKKYGATE